MQIYLVGGAVRDHLLGIPVKERDWVVVGATPEDMLALGYRAVGKDFPVFLHPETHEEYALARTERKTGRGYKGFTFHADPQVSLEEDLIRRDLTINAIAQDDEGNLIDPYGGQQDLANKMLRHVSPAFAEDPVRILRLARFAAKLPEFHTHPETIELMKQMVKNGEVDALVPERVWQEMKRAFNKIKPVLFFQTLADCDALAVLFPAISMAGQGMICLAKAAAQHKTPIVQFAALLHDIPEEKLQALIKCYRVPNEFNEVALLVCRYKNLYQQLLQATAEDILTFIMRTDALRRPERFQMIMDSLCICFDDKHQERLSLIEKCISAVKNINIKALQEKNLKGKDLADAIHLQRLDAIEKITQ